MTLVQCPECHGFGTIFHPRRGGNDPDGEELECETCAGEGAIMEEADAA